MNNLKFRTGDILLYNTQKWYSKFIEYFLGENYSHIAIILKNPNEWLDSKLNEEEYYILESGAESFPDSESGKLRFGVQIVPFSKIYNQYKYQGYGKLYHRKLKLSTLNSIHLQNKIKEAYLKIKDKPYDLNIFDWIIGYYELDKNIDSNKILTNHYQKTSAFWCSALVSYIFVECEVLNSNIAWTLVAPIDYANWKKDISVNVRKLPLINNCEFGKMSRIC